MDANLTPEQSLKLIESMIGQAKRSFQRMSFYFLLWGGLLLVATLTEYCMGRAGLPNGWLGWPILGTLGGIIAGGMVRAKGGRPAWERSRTRCSSGCGWRSPSRSSSSLFPVSRSAPNRGLG